MYLKIRRLFEIIGIIAFSPLVLIIMAIAAFAVRMDSPGPVLFCQIRPGYRSKPFTMLKFRTMYVQTEETFRLTSHNDARVTRVGGFLRKYKIDELPQLINVLKGEMSIIGPRPEPQELTEQLEKDIPGYELRRNILPGMTGWAQVHQGYTKTTEQAKIKLSYDLYYIENVALLLDMRILWLTCLMIVRSNEIQ